MANINKQISFIYKNILLFLFVGLSITIPLGLVILTKGPTRYIANISSKNNWSLSFENNIQKGVIFLFILLCYLLTYVVTKRITETQNKKQKKIALFVLSCLLVCSSYIFAFQPEFLIYNNSIDEEINSGATKYHFGSYPDEEKLLDLKSQGYTAVISLLHEMVVPAEPILKKKEEIAAKKIGIQVISIPMLPWVVDNDSAIVKIKKLAKNGNGKYYVHCYLGRDRANIFKNIIQTENQKAIITSNIPHKNIATISSFERGKITKIGKEIYVTPFPTDEEFFSYLLHGKIKSIVNILPTNSQEEQKLIEKESKILQQYNISFTHLPFSNSDGKRKQLIDSIKKLPKPMVIHSFHSNSAEINSLKKLLE